MSHFLEVHANEADMPVVQRLIAALEAFALEITSEVKIGDAAFCVHIKPPVDPLEFEGEIVQTTGKELYLYREGQLPRARTDTCVLYQQDTKRKVGWLKGEILTNGKSIVIEQPYTVLGKLKRLHFLDPTPLDMFLFSFRSVRKARYGEDNEIECLFSED